MSRSRIAVLACAFAAVLPGAAQAQEGAQPTVQAVGTGSVKPAPVNKKRQDSIAAAVAKAREKALPKAIADARLRAQQLAAAAGLTLGALVTVSDEPGTSPFSPWGQDGTFGPGRFCGLVRSPKYRTVNGKRRRAGMRTRRTCRVPNEVERSVRLTFATTAPPA